MNMTEKKMNTKEVAQICGVTEKTVRENAKTFGKTFENGKPTEWTEEELKKVQLVLMKNQISQGTDGSVVKSTVETISDIDGFKYYKEDICGMCNVSNKTFERFLTETSMSNRDFISIGSSHKKLYNEDILNKFQLWLMNNQVSQGVQVEVVKNNIKSNVQVGLTFQEIVNSGNVEAMKELTTFAMNACAEVARNKQLEEQNKLLLEQKQAAIEEVDRIYQVEHNFHNKSYSASQIAAELGVTPKKIGALANQHRLKIDPIYGKLCKIQLQNGKWVDQFMYNEEAKEVLANLIAEEV